MQTGHPPGDEGNRSFRCMAPCFLILLLLAAITASCRSKRDPLSGFPLVVLWAWERPERLGYLDPRQAGVAFLAGTITWREGHVTWRPRYQALEVPARTVVMAVIRMESNSLPLPNPNTIASRILEAVELARVHDVQIDFDARLSEREWYATVLRVVRQRLRANVSLNITALASWCLGDPWIRNLPINDAVPMLFRMGQGEPSGVTDFSAEVCRSSVGISTDEALLTVPRGRRLFIFHPRPWTPEAYRAAMEIARRLR